MKEHSQKVILQQTSNIIKRYDTTTPIVSSDTRLQSGVLCFLKSGLELLSQAVFYKISVEDFQMIIHFFKTNVHLANKEFCDVSALKKLFSKN